MTEPARAQWGSSLEFILTVVGYAVGLGNVWRFPYLVFSNGGGAFIIIFLLLLFIVGIPIFFLEVAIGQFSGLGPTHVFYRMVPIFHGIGYAGLAINAIVGFYYNVVISYCVYYFIFSLRARLPWASCGNSWNTPNCAIRNETQNCSSFSLDHPYPKSPSEEFFYNRVLHIGNEIGNLGDVVYPIALCLLAAWVIVFLALSKGVQSLGKVSYVTAIFPYLMLTVLVITGATLTGSHKGVEFYIGSVNMSKFKEPSVWKDAASQVFFSTSACSGGLIAMSSFNAFKNNILRDVFLIPMLDCFTGIYAGFAIFSVLGYMFQTKCASTFQEVVAAGAELAFIVYPEGISLIKAVPPLWSTLFFLMMLALGFGSEFSIMETTMIMVIDLFKKKLNTRLKQILTRLAICIVYFLLALVMTTRGGFFVLTLLNTFAVDAPLIIVGLLEVVVIAWIYGSSQLIKDVEAMVGPKPKWFWLIWQISWKFICPPVLLAIIIGTFLLGHGEVSVNGVVFPPWYIAIGWGISAVPLAMIPLFAIIQIIRYKCDWRALFTPDPAYYANMNANLKADQERELELAVSNYSLDKLTPNNSALYDNGGFVTF